MGIPIKDNDCLVSLLNLASLKAEKTGIAKGKPSKIEGIGVFKVKVASINSMAIKAGNTPKVTISAKESKSFPIGELAFNNLAANPSRKSNKQAKKIKYDALTRFPLVASSIPRTPHKRFRQVIVFGMCLCSFILQVLILPNCTKWII